MSDECRTMAVINGCDHEDGSADNIANQLLLGSGLPSGVNVHHPNYQPGIFK